MRTLRPLIVTLFLTATAPADDVAVERQFSDVQRLLKTFCFDCHSTASQVGDLDLERFTSVQDVRNDLKPWQAMIQQLETGEMPPREQQQPSDRELQQLLNWTKQILDSEARARAGDPGNVPLHRLSNTEYNNTIRDLTGIDLQPTQTFPTDGAAGEGFTNAAESLSMSPALMSRYVDTAKRIAAHAVLLPDGFRFSPSTTPRDWTDESLARLRAFYRPFTSEGSLPLKPYMAALIEHRAALQSRESTFEQIAADADLSPRYLKILWTALNGTQPSWPLDRVRAQWRTATPKDVDVDAMVAEVSAWFDRLWEFPRIGSYVNERRQVAHDPEITESQPVRVNAEIIPGRAEVTLYFAPRNTGAPVNVVFANPRFTADGVPPLLLGDYQDYRQRYEFHVAEVFANTSAYLHAAIEVANNAKSTPKVVATRDQLDPELLKRWLAVLAVKPIDDSVPSDNIGRTVPAVLLKRLQAMAPNPEHPAVNGWRPEGADLPIVISNASDKVEHVPGLLSPHAVAVHPMPAEFVAVAWKSPVTGRVQVHGKIAHVHPACGNGVAWWLEKQTTARSSILGEGTIDLGKQTDIESQEVQIHVGDSLLLAVDARDSSHVCDLTQTDLTITELGSGKGRVWDLATDVANDIAAGNPHADSHGIENVWSFVTGPAKDRPNPGNRESNTHPLLARWRQAASEPGGQAEASELAKQLQTLLTGRRPEESNATDRKLYDELASSVGPLLRGLNFSHIGQPANHSAFGIVRKIREAVETGQAAEAQIPGRLPDGLFGSDKDDDNRFVVSTNSTVSITLPAALLAERQFEVDCTLEPEATDAAVQIQVLTKPPTNTIEWNASVPIVAWKSGTGRSRLLRGLTEFRRLFPPNVCYPHVIPLDEVVCLKTFHREDQPLIDLFLNPEQTAELERLWSEHRFITKFPIVENEYLPLFIGFVTQDQPQSLVDYFESKRPEFQKRADDFQSDFRGAAPKQLQQLLTFAAKAWRRPLTSAEQQGLRSLYQQLRGNDLKHEKAFRRVLARVLMSASFLLHLEQPPAGTEAADVNDWELASRLSYFLWASMPDQALRDLATSGTLRRPDILEEQTRRMLKDDRSRALALEFGTQWLHVREFDVFDEKNEVRFPTFAALRPLMHEESIRFFQDLFHHDRPALSLLNADHTFLNEPLARHYDIPNVTGQEFRRVDNVRQYGRGGILGLASVQAKQAGASRSSPILRGTFVVETLLGEKLPRPPPNVPQFPESELDNDQLSMREIVKKHVSDSQCATCHQRIDPYGLALEQFDAIGRRRVTGPDGQPTDVSAKLRDGTKFAGIDGLRTYLLTNRKRTFVRMFYRRLVGYALGRAVSISDQVLIDQILEVTNVGEDGVSEAVVAIVQSPQFRRIRGANHTASVSTTGVPQ